MSKVLVIDQEKHPCSPVHPGQARRLLKAGKAVIYRHAPFVIRLKKRQRQREVEPLRLKFDPGATTTGIALVNDANGQVVWAAELSHRGKQVKEKLRKRRAVRRSRRQRHTRYRAAHFANRRRPSGWLAPSLLSRVGNVLTWTKRLIRWCPIGAITIEMVRFDTQLLQNPEIEGLQYQQGTLFGYEIRGYLLEKWGRACMYCDVPSVPLQVEHVIPKARGGSDRISNLVLSCEACNLAKGEQDVRVFLAEQPERLARILSQLKTPLRAAAVVNMTRWRIVEELSAIGLPLEMSTGGRTQYNRVQRELPKAHWIDAAVTGKSTPDQVDLAGIRPWLIAAAGQQSRQMMNVNKHGFPKGRAKGPSQVQGFRTGDLVKASVPVHLKAKGIHIGRVLVRTRRIFDVQTRRGRITDIPARYCLRLQARDGYRYTQGTAFPPHG